MEHSSSAKKYKYLEVALLRIMDYKFMKGRHGQMEQTEKIVGYQSNFA
jgi:hypothetical protein